MRESFWKSTVNSESAPLTAEMLLKAYEDSVKGNLGYFAHGTPQNPHVFNPRIYEGKDAMCMGCGQWFSYFAVKHLIRVLVPK
jgi:hypothetical protein